MVDFIMNGTDINWRDSRNIEIVERESAAHKTMKSLADFLGLPIQNLLYVLKTFLPDIRERYRKRKQYRPKKVVADTEMPVSTPDGAEYYIDGLFFKIGMRDRVMRHNGSEWVSSTRTKENIQRAARRRT